MTSSTTTTPSSIDSSISLKQWLIENSVLTVDPIDPIFQPSSNNTTSETPWRHDPHYFTHVKISAIALIKMVIHARAGAPLEVMGLMQGKIMDRTMIVMDAFALPVQGTETRVNAQQEAFEYMVQYQSAASDAGRIEHILGWYHSHPGYGCWLSGIDVSTQLTNQQYQEPFLAIVVDPNRTISAGRVEIGAFRTYPPNYTPPNATPSEYQSIPLSKIEDFGVHANQYYALDVSIFKSKLDAHLLELLWNKHWISTLSQSPLTTNKDYLIGQLADVAAKLYQANTQIVKPRVLGSTSSSSSMTTSTTQFDPIICDRNTPILTPQSSSTSMLGTVDQLKLTKNNNRRSTTTDNNNNTTLSQDDTTHLGKASRDATKVVSEVMHSLLSQVLKHIVFNMSTDGIATMDLSK